MRHRSKEKRLDGSDSTETEEAQLVWAPTPAFWRGCIHHATPPANPEHRKSICHISKIMAFSGFFFSLCLLLSDPLKCRQGTFSGFSQESETWAFLFFFFFPCFSLWQLRRTWKSLGTWNLKENIKPCETHRKSNCLVTARILNHRLNHQIVQLNVYFHVMSEVECRRPGS